MEVTPRGALLHGFAGTQAVWHDVQAQCPGWFAAPLPGHEGEPAAATWDGCVAQVAQSLAAAGLQDAPVVGYSLGARLALALLSKKLTARVILISCHPGLPMDDIARTTRRRDDDDWAQMLATHPITHFVDAWEAQALFATQARVSPTLRAARRAARLQLDGVRLAAAMRAMSLSSMPDYRETVAARASDITWVVGEEDTKFVALADELARLAPALALVRVPNAGHDLTLEAPAAIASLIATALG